MGAGELADVSAGGGGCMVGAAVTQKCFRCLPCTVLSLIRPQPDWRLPETPQRTVIEIACPWVKFLLNLVC